MIRLLSAIRAELLIADAYPDDWYRWTGGQAGHAVIIGWPLALILMAIGCPPTAAPVAVAALYFWGWEIAVQRGRDWRDSSADTWHVACGAGLACAPVMMLRDGQIGPMLAVSGAMWAVWIATIIDGIRRRMPEKDL